MVTASQYFRLNLCWKFVLYLTLTLTHCDPRYLHQASPANCQTGETSALNAALVEHRGGRGESVGGMEQIEEVDLTFLQMGALAASKAGHLPTPQARSIVAFGIKLVMEMKSVNPAFYEIGWMCPDGDLWVRPKPGQSARKQKKQYRNQNKR